MSRADRDELERLRALVAQLEAEKNALAAGLAKATTAPAGATRRLLGFTWYPDGSMALDEFAVDGGRLTGHRQLHPKDWPNVTLGVAERWNDHYRHGSQDAEFHP